MSTLYTILFVVGIMIVAVSVVLIINAIARRKKGLTAESEFVCKMLPNVDCGMCGEENCANFAKKVVAFEKNPEECKLIKPEMCDRIHKYFKPANADEIKQVAYVKCKGGCLAVDKYIYKGSKNCNVEEALHSGAKACKFACLGCGDCAKACRFGAISINKRGVAVVDRNKCTGCGACLSVCPNNLIAMQKLSQSVAVICNNQSSDVSVKKKCEVGCSHCGKCLKVCPVDAVKIVDNVPVIDETKCIECGKCVVACPNHCISRM